MIWWLFMKNNDYSILSHIYNYCIQINDTLAEYDRNKERFINSATCRNAICLCLLQIGELVSLLNDEFKNENTSIQWREIKFLRNIVAHRYFQVDYDIIWDICMDDIPVLMNFCSVKLNN